MSNTTKICKRLAALVGVFVLMDFVSPAGATDYAPPAQRFIPQPEIAPQAEIYSIPSPVPAPRDIYNTSVPIIPPAPYVAPPSYLPQVAVTYPQPFQQVTRDIVASPDVAPLVDRYRPQPETAPTAEIFYP